MRILIVEDEANIRQQLVDALTADGYAVDAAKDGEEGLYYGREFPIDIAVVDLGLPKIDGVTVIKTLREEGFPFPILVLTARDGWEQKVEGLDAGADDYLVKPFVIEELKARLNALLRRSRGFSSPVLQFGRIAIDTAAKSVLLDDSAVTLTAFEYKVIEYLAMHPGKVISKTELVEHIYEEDSERDSNVLEVFIRRLRVKLDPDEILKPIETVRGHGYRFVLAAS